MKETPTKIIDEAEVIGTGNVKVIIALGEVTGFYKTMKDLKGILNNEKACQWGRDCRLIKEKVDEIESIVESIKTDDFTALQEEFTKLAQENPDKSQTEIIKSWDKGIQYIKEIESFNKRYVDLMKRKIEFMFETKWEPKDIHKIETGEAAEMLSWFM